MEKKEFIEFCEVNGISVELTDDNLSVGGYLYLRGTQISSLPDNLSVGGYIYQ